MRWVLTHGDDFNRADSVAVKDMVWGWHTEHVISKAETETWTKYLETSSGPVLHSRKVDAGHWLSEFVADRPFLKGCTYGNPNTKISTDAGELLCLQPGHSGPQVLGKWTGVFDPEVDLLESFLIFVCRVTCLFNPCAVWLLLTGLLTWIPEAQTSESHTPCLDLSSPPGPFCSPSQFLILLHYLFWHPIASPNDFSQENPPIMGMVS